MPIERVTVKAITAHLARRGAWFLKVVPTGRGRRGIPDILCCYRGIFVALEVKRGDVPLSASQPTELQKVELAAIKRAGGISAVVRSVDDAAEILDQVDNLGPPPALESIALSVS